MPQILVDNLEKRFRVAARDPGMWGAVRGLVRRRYREVVVLCDLEEMDYAIAPRQGLHCFAQRVDLHAQLLRIGATEAAAARAEQHAAHVPGRWLAGRMLCGSPSSRKRGSRFSKFASTASI